MNTKVLQLFPKNAYVILKEKNLLNLKFDEIYYPWDDNYDYYRTFFSLRIQQRPLIIIRPTNVDEIRRIFNIVKEKNLTFRIVNGRSSTQLVSCQLMLDISNFNKIIISDDIITVGGGSTQGQAKSELFKNNKCYYSHFGHHCKHEAFPGGSAATVGCGGICTVGGIGTLKRTYGLTIDSVISYTIVVPPKKNKNAKILTASANENCDLFWALRGGGANNFGIVTSIKLKTLNVPDIVPYSVTFNFNDAVNVLNKWKQTSIERPFQFNEEIYMGITSESSNELILDGFYVNTENFSHDKIEKEIHDQLDILGGTLTIKDSRSYSKYYEKLVKNRVYQSFSVIQTFFTNDYDSEILVNRIKLQPEEGVRVIALELLGGKIKEKSSSETAFYPRKYNFFLDISTHWSSFEYSQPNELWANQTVSEIFDMVNYTYLGFPITFSNIKHTSNTYYGKNLKRLKCIKNQYDPLGLLSSTGTL